jgi:hypothetical protein
VVVDGFMVIPGGSDPETMAQELGVQPFLVWITAEYAVLTVPLGRLVVVVIVMFAKHGEANRTSNRESRGSLISPWSRCCRNVEKIREVA